MIRERTPDCVHFSLIEKIIQRRIQQNIRKTLAYEEQQGRPPSQTNRVDSREQMELIFPSRLSLQNTSTKVMHTHTHTRKMQLLGLRAKANES